MVNLELAVLVREVRQVMGHAEEEVQACRVGVVHAWEASLHAMADKPLVGPSKEGNLAVVPSNVHHQMVGPSMEGNHQEVDPSSVDA